MEKATLLLSDGTRYVGKPFGANVETAGIMAFDTGVIGCIERLTDPAVSGKLMTFTFPDIGGHGVIPQDFYSDKVHAAGVVTRNWAKHPSNWQSQGNLDALLKEQGIPGIYGIDTRALMIRLRSGGELTGALLQGERDALSADLPAMLASAARPAQPQSEAPSSGEGSPYVGVVDLGCGRSLAANLAAQGARVRIVSPADAASGGFDAIALSDGPEDGAFAHPLALPAGVPVYGEGLGHLLLAKARGGSLARMGTQHGGANLPVKWGDNVYITSQFHAWAVSAAPDCARETIYNLNDRTVEALLYDDAITVQFPLSVAKGPHDMSWVYGRFLSMAKG